MNITTEDFILGYLASSPEIFESASIWASIGELHSFIEMDQHEKLIASVLGVAFEVVESTIKRLLGEGTLGTQYRSSKKYYYGQELVLKSNERVTAEKKTSVVAMISEWVRKLFDNSSFVATYYLAVHDSLPDELLAVLIPVETEQLFSSGIVGKIIPDPDLPRQRKLLMFKQGTATRQIVDGTLASETSYMSEVGKIRKDALAQLPETQRQLLSVISTIGSVTIAKSMDTKYYPVTKRAQETWNDIYSEVEITKPAVLAIARWDTDVDLSELEKAFQKLEQKKYLVQIKKYVYSGVSKIDLVPVIPSPRLEACEKTDIAEFVEELKKQDITLIFFLDEVLARQRSDRLSVKRKYLQKFESLTESPPPREIPPLFLQTDEEITINPRLRKELSLELEKQRQVEAMEFFTQVAALKNFSVGRPLHSAHVDHQLRRIRLFTPKAAYLFVIEPWLTSKNVEEILSLSSQADETVVFVLRQKEPWVKELFRYADIDSQKITLAYVNGEKIHLRSKSDEILSGIISKYLTNYQLVTDGQFVVKPKAETQKEGIDLGAPEYGRFVTDLESVENKMSKEIVLGKQSNGKEFRIHFDDSNSNLNIMIVGESGAGKTTTIKTILRNLTNNGTPYLILDLANSFSDLVDTSIDIKNPNAPSINPLELYSSNITPYDNSTSIADIIGGIFKELGGVQRPLILEALKSVYLNNGFVLNEGSQEQKPIPLFEEFFNKLEVMGHSEGADRKKQISNVLLRLDPIKEYKMFSRKMAISFEKLTTSRSSILLKDLPSDEIRGLVVEFFLRKLFTFFESKDEVPTIDARIFCVIDEIHNLAREDESPLVRCLRELRKRGVAFVLASQFPRDFSEFLSGNIETRISHRCEQPPHAADAAATLAIEMTQSEIRNYTKEISHLNKGEALVRHKDGQVTKVSRVKVNPSVHIQGDLQPSDASRRDIDTAVQLPTLIYEKKINSGQRLLADNIVEQWMEQMMEEVIGELSFLDKSTFGYIDMIPRGCGVRLIVTKIKDEPKCLEAAQKAAENRPYMTIIRILYPGSAEGLPRGVHERWVSDKGHEIEIGTDLKSDALGKSEHTIQVFEDAVKSEKYRNFIWKWNASDSELKRLYGNTTRKEVFFQATA